MKKFKETIVFVPFFGGNQSSLHLHMEFVEELGFDWVFVPLEFSLLKMTAKPVSANSAHFGMKGVWADHIEKVLNQIPGQKIVYAFSNPSASAIEAIARRNANDVSALICDSGPTGEVWKSMLNYFRQENLVPTWPLKVLGSAFYTYLMTSEPSRFCFDDLERMPKDFPILSIRGWKDNLISPKQIDLIFEPHPQIQWQKLSLPKAGHVDGLKNFPSEYKKAVSLFLENQATTISSRPQKDLHP